jgi:hypothetical protein
MILAGNRTRSIWVNPDGWSVGIFDQRKLPWSVEPMRLTTADDCAHAIADMATRGAPLIGAVAAYGLALALRVDAGDEALDRAYRQLLATRPTAVNLKWALDRVRAVVTRMPEQDRAAAAYADAAALCDEDVAINEAIGRAGLELLKDLSARNPDRPLNILTHCNAGWLATVDWGTATAPLYMAHDLGIPLHVWVDETRPRNQGALTALELAGHGVPHSYVVDNAGGLLMQRGQVDLRHRPCHAQRRRLQQDRNVSEGAGGARQRHPVRGRAPVLDLRCEHRRRGVGPCRGTRGERGPVDRRPGPGRRAATDSGDRVPRREPRVRHHPRPAGQRVHHRQGPDRRRGRTRGGVRGIS